MRTKCHKEERTKNKEQELLFASFFFFVVIIGLCQKHFSCPNASIFLDSGKKLTF